MKFNAKTVAQCVGIAATTVCLTAVVGEQQAQAFTLNGWDYAMGASNNSTGSTSGNGYVYEMHNIAIKDAGDKLMVAISANTDYLNPNKGINYGDLFFNFTGKNFKQASQAGELFAVHFATAKSQSGVSEVGLYSGVKAKAVGKSNQGWKNLNDMNKYVTKTLKTTSDYGDLNATDSYFAGQHTGKYTILNSIASGTKVADISMLDAGALAGAGLDMGLFGEGTHTFGFSFDKSMFGTGDFTANMFLECGNDGLAIKSGSSAAVPEPTTMTGLALAGAGMLAARRRRRQKSA